jgi:dTDP-4-amino-4,6-dideoxygalactose transaminase
VTLPYQHPDTQSSWHLFVIKTRNRERLFNHLKMKEIITQVHYMPLSSQPFYNGNKLKNSFNYYQHCLSLPIYPDLSSEDQVRVINNTLGEEDEF